MSELPIGQVYEALEDASIKSAVAFHDAKTLIIALERKVREQAARLALLEVKENKEAKGKDNG